MFSFLDCVLLRLFLENVQPHVEDHPDWQFPHCSFLFQLSPLFQPVPWGDSTIDDGLRA